MKAPSEAVAVLTGFAWGMAEGIFFFIVPDPLLCYWALQSPKKALASTLGVVAGAVCAAAILYTSLDHVGDPGTYGAYRFFHELWSHLPGFRPGMAAVAANHLRESGSSGLLHGPTSGIPYRVYVLEAWKLQLPLSGILLWTPIARLERILIAPAVVLLLKWLGRKFLPRFLSGWQRMSLKKREKQLNLGLAIGVTAYWIVLYAWYWGSFIPRTYG